MLNATANDPVGAEQLTDCIKKYYLSTAGIPVTSGEIVRMRADLISKGTDKFARFMKKSIESGLGETNTNLLSTKCNFTGESLGGSPISIAMECKVTEKYPDREVAEDPPENPGGNDNPPVDLDPDDSGDQGSEQVPDDPPVINPPESNPDGDESEPGSENPVPNPEIGEGTMPLDLVEEGDDELGSEEGNPDPAPEPEPPVNPDPDNPGENEEPDPEDPENPDPEDPNEPEEPEEPAERIPRFEFVREYDAVWTQERDSIHMTATDVIYDDTNMPDVVIAMVGDIFKIVNHLLECEFIEITKEQYDAAVEALVLTNRTYKSGCTSCHTKDCQSCAFTCKAKVFSDMTNEYLCNGCDSLHRGVRYYTGTGVLCPRCTYALIVESYSTVTGPIDLCSHNACLCMPDEMLIAVIDQIIEIYKLPINKVLGKLE